MSKMIQVDILLLSLAIFVNLTTETTKHLGPMIFFYFATEIEPPLSAATTVRAGNARQSPPYV